MSEAFLKAADKRDKRNAEIAEVDIEGPFVKYAKRQGCRAVKLIILNKRGFPDRTVLCPGARVFFIEFKRKGKKPSAVQRLVRGWLEPLGFEWHVCDKPGQAEAILDDFIW